MKKVSANALGIIEHEHDNTLKVASNMNINRFSCEGAPYDDEFEDALGQDDLFPTRNDLIVVRKCLPVLRAPKKKKSI